MAPLSVKVPAPVLTNEPTPAPSEITPTKVVGPAPPVVSAALPNSIVLAASPVMVPIVWLWLARLRSACWWVSLIMFTVPEPMAPAAPAVRPTPSIVVPPE